jgi:glycosyltransferase involved in cell wall biosynthesis
VRLSVVIPVFNEAAVLPELVRRVREAVLECVGEGEGEVIIVDDASRDATRALAADLGDAVVRFLHLTNNRGQTGATMEGVGRARGAVVAVLDGDLQDPPEHLPALYAALAARPDLDVAYAVKSDRHEAPAARAAFAAYHLLQRACGEFALPPGAGSYCAFRAPFGEALRALPTGRANLATLLAARRPRFVAVPYVKAARPDGDSRVGMAGLLREAADSLATTRALGRVAVATALGVTAASSALAPARRRRPIAGVVGIICLGLVGLAFAHERRLAPPREGAEP